MIFTCFLFAGLALPSTHSFQIRISSTASQTVQYLFSTSNANSVSPKGVTHTSPAPAPASVGIPSPLVVLPRANADDTSHPSRTKRIYEHIKEHQLMRCLTSPHLSELFKLEKLQQGVAEGLLRSSFSTEITSLSIQSGGLLDDWNENIVH